MRFSIREKRERVSERCRERVEAKECCRQGQINDLQHEEVTIVDLWTNKKNCKKDELTFREFPLHEKEKKQVKNWIHK